MRFSILYLLVLVVSITGCRNNGPEVTQSESEHNHGAGTIPYTVFSDSCEYFAEITPMIKGSACNASVHITRLNNYQPLSRGILTITVYQEGRPVGSGDTNQPRIPGIFPVTFTPAKAGPVVLSFVFRGDGLVDSVQVSGVQVFESDSAADASPRPEDPSGNIRFTKEMAWKIDFNVLKLLPSDYYNSVKVSGEFLIPPSEITTLTAKSDGILIYRQPGLIAGMRIEPGSVLFSLTGKGLTERNMETNLSGLRSRFEASKAAFEREETLVKEQIVSQKQFQETNLRYTTDSVQYYSYLRGFSGSGMDVSAPSGGSVVQLFHPNGTYVTEGTPLLTYSNNRSILLRADLPQNFWKELPQIQTGSFRPSGSSEMYDIEAAGGRMIAKGTSLSTGNSFIPVTFTLPNNGAFIPGSFAEVYLHTTPMKEQIVIPVSSLMEDQGSFYVYVQTGGESFVKRSVRLKFIDGEFANVASGLAPGEWVVTKGAIFIKAASVMSGGAPSHGHEH
jgi:RND family efflux transporter MFP subunit